MSQEKQFGLYFDDIGSGRPGKNDPFPYFGLGGIIVDRSDEQEIRDKIRLFKTNWDIPLETPLHGSEIRSQKGSYRWLEDKTEDETIRFKTELLDLIISLPIVVHGCIVERAGYLKRYHARYGRNTWEMRKSAVTILVERTAKYVQNKRGAQLSVFFEICGTQEDTIVKDTYNSLRTSGHCFDPTSAEKYNPASKDMLCSILAPKPFARKKDNELLQIADLCLYPIATSRNKKPNKAYDSFRANQKIVDTLLDSVQIAELGVKYYCFDA